MTRMKNAMANRRAVKNIKNMKKHRDDDDLKKISKCMQWRRKIKRGEVKNLTLLALPLPTPTNSIVDALISSQKEFSSAARKIFLSSFLIISSHFNLWPDFWPSNKPKKNYQKIPPKLEKKVPIRILSKAFEC